MGMYLPSRVLAENVYSDFTVPAFGRHVAVTVRACISEVPSSNLGLVTYCHD
jgi:hypothetical protein